MLRLAGLMSDAVQEVITEQMIWGFQKVFGIDTEGKIKREKVKDFLQKAEHINSEEGVSEQNLEGIAGRLEQMYQNLMNQEREYTWDEFGEFLLNECLLYFGEQIDRNNWQRFGMSELRLPDLAYGSGHEDVLFWDDDFAWYQGWNAMTGAVHTHGDTVCTLSGESIYE